MGTGVGVGVGVYRYLKKCLCYMLSEDCRLCVTVSLSWMIYVLSPLNFRMVTVMIRSTLCSETL